MTDVKRPSPLGDALHTWITRHGMAKRFDLAAAVATWPDAVGAGPAAGFAARTTRWFLGE